MSSSTTLTLNLTDQQRRAIEQVAQRDNVSMEEAVLRAVQQVLAQETPEPFPPGTPFHGLGHVLKDLGEGPEDLSTNHEYLDDLGR